MSTVICPDIAASDGVIHAVDSLISVGGGQGVVKREAGTEPSYREYNPCKYNDHRTELTASDTCCEVEGPERNCYQDFGMGIWQVWAQTYYIYCST